MRSAGNVLGRPRGNERGASMFLSKHREKSRYASHRGHLCVCTCQQMFMDVCTQPRSEAIAHSGCCALVGICCGLSCRV
eukprot:15476972-Alexandrium_andersonii.AAC.1